MKEKKMYISPETETTHVHVESLMAVISPGKDDEDAGARRNPIVWDDDDE